MTVEQIKNELNSPSYNFLQDNEHLGRNIILLTLGGSHAYGMSKEGSDIDIRGIELNPKSDISISTKALEN